MRTTTFRLDASGVVAESGEPRWAPFDQYDGEPLTAVRLHEIADYGGVELQYVEIGVGGDFAMHASPSLAFCHIARGAGTLRLPEGRSLSYRGPETYVFEPGTVHGWSDITETTMLVVAIIPLRGGDQDASGVG